MAYDLPGTRRIKALPRICARLIAGAAAFLLVLFAALVLWLRYVALPNVDRYRPDIIEFNIEVMDDFPNQAGRTLPFLN
jgi:uncharacterized protein YhdP